MQHLPGPFSCALASLLLLAGCPMMDDDEDDTGNETSSGASTDPSSTDPSTTASSTDPSTTDPSTTASSTDPSTTDPSSTDPSSTDASSESGTETGASGHVEGVVHRTVPLAEGEDGIGTLFIGAFAECDHAAPLVGVFVLPMADFSQDDAEVPFAFDELAVETVYLAGFLDDDGNADLMMPLPDEGDPVLAEDVHDGLLTCIEVDVAAGESVVFELNAIESDER